MNDSDDDRGRVPEAVWSVRPGRPYWLAPGDRVRVTATFALAEENIGRRGTVGQFVGSGRFEVLLDGETEPQRMYRAWLEELTLIERIGEL